MVFLKRFHFILSAEGFFFFFIFLTLCLEVFSGVLCNCIWFLGSGKNGVLDICVNGFCFFHGVLQ